MTLGQLPSSGMEQKRSFWGNYEGITGGVFIAAAIGVVAFFGWGTVVPFVLATAYDTLKLMWVLIGIVATGIVAWMFRRSLSLLSLIFKYTMRRITNTVVTIFPEEITENHILSMKKSKEQFAVQSRTVGAAVKRLKDTIALNKASSDKNMALASEARRHVSATSDPIEIKRWSLDVKLKADSAQRLLDSNQRYGDMLDRVQKLYGRLQDYSVNIDYMISETEDQVRQANEEHNVVNSTLNAWTSAMAILNGDATEDDLFNRGMAFLAEDSSNKLGQIEDMERMTQNVMDGIDLERGVMDTKALAALDNYEKNLLASGDKHATVLLTGAPAQQQLPETASSYNDLFKR